jgi:hypothetical protein
VNVDLWWVLKVCLIAIALAAVLDQLLERSRRDKH